MSIPEDIEVGDIITYVSDSPETEGMKITHRVVSIIDDEESARKLMRAAIKWEDLNMEVARVHNVLHNTQEILDDLDEQFCRATGLTTVDSAYSTGSVVILVGQSTLMILV